MTKIALIEDNAVISQMYRMKFESEGFDVKLATNGESGIALVKDFSMLLREKTEQIKNKTDINFFITRLLKIY